MSARHPDLGDLDGALAAYETSPSLLLACEGPDLVVRSANAAARSALDGARSIGRPAHEVAPGPGSQPALDVAQRVLRSGEPETTAAWRFRGAGLDGEPHDLFYDLTVSPWRDEAGTVRGVLVHGLDVTGSVLRGADEPMAEDDLEAVVALQDALLPQWLPVLPCVEVAGCYLVGRGESAAGGDWFDVVGLRDGRVALVVGDVVGHGLSAGAAMGQLRSVAHERLGRAADLEQAMCDLDAFAHGVPEALAATLCVVVLDPVTGEMEYCTAGHPPPLLVPRRAGRPRHLAPSGAVPLATAGSMDVARDRLGRDEVLVLCTDGIVQRPGSTSTRSTVELGQVAASVAGRLAAGGSDEGCVDRMCADTLEVMTRHTGYRDDITLLVAELRGRHRALHLEVDADAAAVPAAVGEVATWMRELRVRELDHIAVQHAVDELVDNAVEHAYTGSGGDVGRRVRLDAELLDSGDLEISVQDWGRWRESGDEGAADQARGLAIVRGMVDRVDVDTGDSGTLVTLRHRLGRPARMLTGVETGASPLAPAGGDRPFGLSRHGDRFSVSGPVHADHVPRLREALRDAAGWRRVVLDLGGVTLLPSVAVQALYRARQEAAQRRQQLVLFAPPGSPAQHVLELVRLPYSLTDPDLGRPGNGFAG
jgi:anti-sigma regulatory factor (Ser/Thr protein kinase)/anti-anti-sigma regulatory factor